MGEERFWIERSDDGAVIRGLEDRFTYGPDTVRNSYMDALNLSLQAHGEDVTYSYVAGASGHAFRAQMSRGGWCPSSMCTGCGSDTMGPALQAVGAAYDVVLFDTASDDIKQAFEHWPSAPPGEMLELVAEHIDAKMPVPTWCEEASIVVGYNRAAGDLILRSYAQWEPGYRTLSEHNGAGAWQPWGLMFLRREGEPPGRTTVLADSLRMATTDWNEPEIGGYHSGRAAWQAWIAELRDEDTVQAWLAASPEPGAHAIGNAYTLRSIWDARRAAVEYLMSFEGELAAAGGGAAWPELEWAADLYRELAQTISDHRALAPYPWHVSDDAPWTEAMRREQADVLERAAALDAEAVGHLAAALELLPRT